MDEQTSEKKAKLSEYEKSKEAIKARKIEEQLLNEAADDEWTELTSPRHGIEIVDVAKIGTGVLIGGGLGLLAGVGTIAVAASAAEIVIGGVITKVAGVVGGAAGLGWGLHSLEKKRARPKRTG